MNVSQLRTALSRPDISMEYVRWRISKAVNGGDARFNLPNGAIVSNFVNFSEYHSMLGCVPAEEFSFFAQLPADDSVIIDVGANLGVVSLFLARQFPDRRIYAFEPGPTTFDALQKNAALNGAENITCLQVALSDSVGEIAFDADPLCRGNARIAGGTTDNIKIVPTTTLDAFVAEKGITSIGFLKIDVEGFEATLLRGARETLKARIPALIHMEVVPASTRSAGFDPRPPIDLVVDAGYQWFRLDGDAHLTPVSVEDLEGVVSENWIARPA